MFSHLTVLKLQYQHLQITETKPDVPVVTLSTKGNAKVLEQLKSGFKSSNNWDKYQSKKPIERQNQSLD